MKINTGKAIHLGNLIDPQDGRGLWLDLSAPAGIGVVEGLQNFSEAISQINTICDGVIVNPGTLEKSAELFGGARRSAPVVRVDWTNYRRGSNFCLPGKPIQHVMISDVEDALRLGAEAVLIRHIMGVEDEFEAENVSAIATLARESDRHGLPVIVEICPVGDQIRGKNFDAIVKLGVACMLEAGVDGLIVPPCSPDVLREIGEWADIPLILKSDELPELNQLESVFTAGFAGILLSEAILGKSDFIADLANLYNRIHS